MPCILSLKCGVVKFGHCFLFIYCIISSQLLISSVARFLESRGMIENALEVATDPDYKFELAIQLGRLEIAKVSSLVSIAVLEVHVIVSAFIFF